MLFAQRYKKATDFDLSQIDQTRIVVKLKKASIQQSRISGYVLPRVDGLLESNAVLKSSSSARSGKSILDGIFIVKISEDKNPIDLCNNLLRYEEVEYAEVLFKEELFQTPDDPYADPVSGSQGYLDVIKAYEAWDYTTGRDDIVIGIVDTGMDLSHEDIVDSYYSNPIETLNGDDDDDNGYIDDIIGYDFADNDSDAQADGNQHGTHVGGIAGASTNNSLGIASVGYNCSVAPLKGFTTANTYSTGVWEGVIYAADNGFDIVNLSWGNYGNFNQYYQDIIDYCVLEKDMVVIAAAGNTNDDIDFYPASYEYVLSVGASTLSDTKWSSGTYSDHIDIIAPGQSIFSTQNDDTYNSDSGSSHSSPMVAGAAGLVKSVFPQYNARQIMEQLRVTSDDIYGVSGNEAYPYKLGKGRLNVLNAVSETITRSLRIHNYAYENAFGSYAFYGDTLTLSYDLTNYLAGLSSPTLGLESESPYVEILVPSSEPGSFSTLESKSQNEIQIIIDEDTPPETEIDIRFTMEEGSYQDFQNISFFTEPDDFNFGNGNLLLKVAGDGSIAYTDSDYSYGYSMEYNDAAILDFGGLMIGTSTSDLNDNVTNDFSDPPTRDNDFIVEKSIKLLPHESLSYYGYSEFSSADGNLWIEQSILPSEDESYLLIQYRIVNISGTDMVDLEVGFFADFVLGNEVDNHTYWDSDLNSLITYDDAQSTFASIALTDETYHYAALDMGTENGNVRDVDDIFTDAEKYDLLSGVNIGEAGTIGVGNDVASLVNTSISNLADKGSLKMTVLLALGDTYEELSTTIDAATIAITEFQNNPPKEEVLYICTGDDLLIDPTNGLSYDFFEDPRGSTYLQTGSQLYMPTVTEDTAIYISNLDGDFPSDIKRIDIRPITDVAQFQISTDTLYLDDPILNALTFTDLSFKASSWLWDFGNGEQSTVPHPVVNFDQTGTYIVQLTVESEIGCTNQISKKLVVADRPDAPVLDNFSICRNETFDLVHDTEEYVVYSNQEIAIQSGQSLSLGPFETDSILLIAQKIEGFESLTIEVLVTVDPLEAIFDILPDTNSIETNALFVYTGENADSYAWRVNGSLEGSNSTLSYPISNPDITVELEVQNGNCTDIVSSTINFKASNVPIVSDLLICNGSDALIQPTNGSMFGFYSDDQLIDLISKGSILLITNVTEHETIYVVGLDEVIPSESIEVTIVLEDFETGIVSDPPQLDLSQGNTVQFKASNISAVLAEWYLDSQLIETSLEPILLFATPGVYEIMLIATNASGCEFEVTSSLVVFDITGITTPLNEVQIYPNPADDIITIVSPVKIDELRLFDLSGQLVFFESINSLNFSTNMNVNSGVYVIELNTSVGCGYYKIIIN
ncbi:MAG: S8 family serine peptidase [Cytophagales bacterium]|nr:S8 family serine peptidase [Cytophagales bacterium]